jgi:hypothetical protein
MKYYEAPSDEQIRESVMRYPMIKKIREAIDSGDYDIAEKWYWPALFKKGKNTERYGGEFPDIVLDIGMELYEKIIKIYSIKIDLGFNNTVEQLKALNGRVHYTNKYEDIVMRKVEKIKSAMEK